MAGFNQELKLATSVLPNGNITAYDVTTYPLSSLEEREDIGLILAWSNEANGTDNIMYSLLNVDESNNWEIETFNNKTYTVHMLAVPKWASGSYALHDIVIHNNLFFHCNALTTAEDTAIPKAPNFKAILTSSFV